MGTVTPVVSPDGSYTRVEVNWQDQPNSRKAWVYREVAGVRTALRDGDPAVLSNGLAVCFDTESPLDCPVVYRSTCPLNANGDMEGGVAEWQDATNSGTVGTVSRSFDYYVRGEGVAALKLTPTGSDVTVRAASEYVPATAGTTYTVSAQLMVPAFWSGGIGVMIAWYTVTNTTNGTSGAATNFTPAPGVFESHTLSAVAPLNTTKMRIYLVMTGTPPATLPLYADEAYVTASTSFAVASSSVIRPAGGKGWWVDPLHPATLIQLQIDLDAACAPTGVAYAGVSDWGRPSDSSLLEVNDSVFPIGIWNRRKSGRSSVRVGTASLADLERVRALHASGAPLLLQLPREFGEVPHYGLHGELQDGRLGDDQRKPYRLVASSFARVAAPIGPPDGVLGVRYADQDKHPTFNDAAAARGGDYDLFDRTISNAWGTSTSGRAWTVAGTATWYQVAGGVGRFVMSTVSVDRQAFAGVSIKDFDIYLPSITTSAGPVGGNTEHRIRARYVDASNFVELTIYRVPGGVCTARIRQVVGGVETSTGFVNVAASADSAPLSAHFRGVGTALSATVWPPLGVTQEPITPLVTQTVTHNVLGDVSLSGLLYGTVSNGPLNFDHDELVVSKLDDGGGLTWLDSLQGEGAG